MNKDTFFPSQQHSIKWKVTVKKRKALRINNASPSTVKLSSNQLLNCASVFAEILAGKTNF
jgi:hypothetical protein